MCGITGFCEISRERHAEELQATEIRMRARRRAPARHRRQQDASRLSDRLLEFC